MCASCSQLTCAASDAAHVHSPTGGQGLNTSIQDSVSVVP
ncbi:FAD-dependent monooxygenase [Bacteroides caccae]|nr:FAD-dependent monooxygenase [Bacteroides caccae]